MGRNLEGFSIWIKGNIRGLVIADEQEKKKETSGAGIWLQSMWYTKLKDADVADSSVPATDAPPNPHVLRML